jgi:hypothetical protein
MKKLLITTAVLTVATSAHAIDCTRPPYGSTMRQYESYIRVSKRWGIPSDPERTIKRICNAKDIPGKPRQALLDVGFTRQEIAETDTVELVIKYLERLQQILRDDRA